MPKLHRALESVLLPAYGPCPAFGHVCETMRWGPANGHVPRGFCGATGELDEVELVLVGAEPGDPHGSESHDKDDAGAQLQSAYDYAYDCFRSRKDLYHRNMLKVMELCWPDASFDQWMRRTCSGSG